MSERSSSRGHGSSSRRQFTTHRRTTLQMLAALSVGGGLVAEPATGQEDDSSGAAGYTVEQGDNTYAVDPISGTVPVEELYDLRIPSEYGGDNGATDPGTGPYFYSVGTSTLQRESTTLTFLYDGPNGVSLVVVHDAPGGDGGSASWTVSGSLDGAEWLVKDDFYTDPGTGEQAETNYDEWRTDGSTHEIDWTWGSSAGDGGVLGYLGDDSRLSITPGFNEAATLFEQFYDGTVERWQFLTGSLDSPRRLSLALDEAVRIRSNSAPKQEGTKQDTQEETKEGEEERKEEKDERKEEKEERREERREEKEERREKKEERKEEKEERKEVDDEDDEVRDDDDEDGDDEDGDDENRDDGGDEYDD